MGTINQLFLLESLSITGGSPTLTACTALYTNDLVSCSGDTSIFLSTGVINFNGNVYTNDSITANTINASTFYSGGTNLIDIIKLSEVTGGTFNKNTDTLTLYDGFNKTINVTGFTDFYTTGATLVGNTVFFNRNDVLSAYTVDLSKYAVDIYSTGVTFTNNELIIARNDGAYLTTYINTLTGLTVTGIISAETMSADTIYLSGQSVQSLFNQIYSAISASTVVLEAGTNISIGGTLINPIINVINNPIFTTLSANSISATSIFTNGVQITGDTYVTGGTYSNGSAIFTNNQGNSFNVNGFYTGSTDVYVTGGTYSNGSTTFTNNTGGTFTISGYFTGNTDVHTTGFTYNNNLFSIKDNTGGTLNVLVNTMSGLTVNGSLLSNSISATTYQNLPLDIHVTGLTFNNANYNLSINQNDGSIYTQNLSILASDVTITGGTYNPSTGIATFTNNTGGTFSVSGFLTGHTDTYVTAMTFTNDVLTLFQTQGNASVSQIISGFTTLSAGTLYVNGKSITGDTYVTGGTYSNGTAIFTNNQGNSFNVNGFYTGSTDIYTTGATFSKISKNLELIRNDNVKIDVNLPVRLFINSSATTISNQLLTIDTITGITNNTNSFVISYITAYDGSVDYGFWKRTLAVNNVGGSVNIIGENSDFDRVSSGMTPSNVVYSASNGTILINISGQTSKNYTWSSNWEIIK